MSSGRISVSAGALSLEDAGAGALDAQVVAQLQQQSDGAVSLAELPYTTVNALDKTMDTVLAVADPRGEGGKKNPAGGNGRLQSRLSWK